MVTVQCPACGARYRIPEKLLNKKAKCKKCGEPFALVPPPPANEENDLLGALADGAVVAPSEAPSPPPSAADGATKAAMFPGAGWSPAGTGPVGEEEAVRMGFRWYLRDVGKSLLFFTRGGDLVTFIIVLVLLSLQIPLAFAPCFGLIGIVIIQGWYMAFRLNIVVGAAGGEDRLPNFTLGEPWEGIILPLLKWLAAWVAALLPFLVGLVYLLIFGQMALGGAFGPFISALTGDFLEALQEQESLGLIVGAVLLLIPMVLWPMMLLVVAVGGIRSLIRFDLMFITIFKTLPAYALVVILVFVGVVGVGLLPTEGSLGLKALITAVKVYASIFTMRVIGLYYHHFKKRFAWSWG
jgi:predicted Zn finger-like uncharacterized protein